jgi:hypothetical protein
MEEPLKFRTSYSQIRQQAKVSILTLLDDNEPLLRELSAYIYDKLFKNYTLKQWGLSPRELSPEVVARVPVYIDYDNRYFTDACQGFPQEGTPAMIQSLLSHPNIEVKLNTPFDSIGRFTNGANHTERAAFSRKTDLQPARRTPCSAISSVPCPIVPCGLNLKRFRGLFTKPGRLSIIRMNHAFTRLSNLNT